MAILYRDTGNQLMCLREKADHTGWESPAWVAQALLAADPVVGRNADGRLEIYLLGTDGALYHVKTSSTGADGWKPAEKFGGGGVRDLTVASTADGRRRSSTPTAPPRSGSSSRAPPTGAGRPSATPSTASPARWPSLAPRTPP
ncbi:hypothetical protein ACFQX6_67265 [Streptosporangium lutulentum]